MTNDIVPAAPKGMGSNPEDWFRYQPEVLDENEDDGTMVESLKNLGEAVIGHRIVKAENGLITSPEYSWRNNSGLILTLDNGTRVGLAEEGDCCAYTEVEKFLLNPELVDHAITGVGTTEGYTKWHIYADFGDVLELDVAWSAGNIGYYGYGFNITVIDIPETPAIDIITIPKPE